MSEKKYYCFCGNNCKYETMTKEQILTAIAEATGKDVIEPDAAYITRVQEQNSGKHVTFWVGTQAQYNALPSIESTCLYIISDDKTAEALAKEIASIWAQLDERANIEHQHDAAEIVTGILSRDRGGTGNDNGRIQNGQTEDEPIGAFSTAEGLQNNAGGEVSHAEGFRTQAMGSYSHAQGNYTQAVGDNSHAEGDNTEAVGDCSHAQGSMSVASGMYSHAGGYMGYAEGIASQAVGYEVTAAGDNQVVFGHYNKISTYGSLEGDENANTDRIDQLIVGNGYVGQKSNSLRLTGTGTMFVAGAYNNSGADYAEFFEWADGNPNNEDRRGLFVTLDGDKIKVATDGDYILGVVSGNPCIIGNSDIDWLGRFLTDEYGTIIRETYTYEVEHIDAATGETVVEYRTGTKPKQNPAYNAAQPYIQRADRKEWAAVGMVGVLAVRDDGSCKVNSYCKPAADGTATASTSAKTGYRVIKRVNDHIVKVIVK